MYLTLHYRKERQNDFVFTLLILMACSMLVFACVVSNPREILQGMVRIIVEPDGLITDYIQLASMGGAFFNAGVVMLLAILLLRVLKVPFTGMSVACCFLMGGFALFGKNPVNTLPILIGVFLYSKYQRQPYARYVYVALFGTTLSPVVTEMGLISQDWPAAIRLVFPVFIGVLIGFILPPISAFTLRVHQGYNLYNLGFAAGFVGVVLVSILRSFGNTFEIRTLWSTGNNLILSIYLYAICLAMVGTGFWLNGRSFRGIIHLTRHSGRSVADFVVMDGLPVTLINMGIVGAFAVTYVLVVGGDLNGPTIGGVMTIMGFGAFGKHIRNIIWIVLGVVISSYCMIWQLNDPSVLLAALFSTGLAPIAGQFGPVWGIIAGIIHSSVVLNVGTLYGGLNLYNNGFAAGMVCIVLLPLIQGLKRGGDKDA